MYRVYMASKIRFFFVTITFSTTKSHLIVIWHMENHPYCVTCLDKFYHMAQILCVLNTQETSKPYLNDVEPRFFNSLLYHLPKGMSSSMPGFDFSSRALTHDVCLRTREKRPPRPSWPVPFSFTQCAGRFTRKVAFFFLFLRRLLFGFNFFAPVHTGAHRFSPTSCRLL